MAISTRPAAATTAEDGTRSPAVLVATLAVVVLALVFALGGRGPLDPESADEVIGRTAVSGMDAGDGYYPAMDRALRSTNGPARTGRAFRLPLVFEAWHLLPGEGAVWLALVALIGVAGVAVARTSDAPLVAPLVAGYLFHVAHQDQHLIVEVWAAPLLVLALACWRRGWQVAAAVLAATATLVRELAVLLLVGGLWSGRRRPLAWLVALGLATAGVLAHFAHAGSYASADGVEAALIGTGGPRRVLDMAGVGFTPAAAFGLVLWPLAWLRLRRDRELARFAGPLLALPLVGLLVGRDYWGFVVVPFLLVLALEELWDLAQRVRPLLPGAERSEPAEA